MICPPFSPQPWQVLPFNSPEGFVGKIFVKLASHWSLRELAAPQTLRASQFIIPSTDPSPFGELSVDVFFPVGGPYLLEFYNSSNERIHHIEPLYVGELWLMAGQSNMQGMGLLEDAPSSSPMVLQYGLQEQWQLAAEPVNFQPEAVDATYQPRDPLAPNYRWPKGHPLCLRGTGPGLAFAKERYALTGLPIGLIPCAKGGSRLSDWIPNTNNSDEGQLYNAAQKRILQVGGTLHGVLWSQGCSEAIEKNVDRYGERLQHLIDLFRTSLNNPSCPWVIAQTLGKSTFGPWDDDPHIWGKLRAEQAQCQLQKSRVIVCSSLGLDCDDIIHLSGKSQIAMGQRLALGAQEITKPQPSTSPCLERVELTTGLYPNEPSKASLIFKVNQAVGPLRCTEARPRGLVAIDSDGVPRALFFKIELRQQTIVAHTGLTPSELEGYRVAYGWGMLPDGNIEDSRGLGLLASSWFPLEDQRLSSGNGHS